MQMETYLLNGVDQSLASLECIGLKTAMKKRKERRVNPELYATGLLGVQLRVP